MDRLASEIAGYAVALAAVAVPLVLVTEVFAMQIADVLTGDGTVVSQDAAAAALRWMVPAAAVQLYAGLAASGLAGLDDYVTAACGYAAGSVTGLVFILARVEPDGIIAVAWGMTLNAGIAFAVPCIGLAVRARRTRMPRRAVRPTGPPLGTGSLPSRRPPLFRSRYRCSTSSAFRSPGGLARGPLRASATRTLPRWCS